MIHINFKKVGSFCKTFFVMASSKVCDLIGLVVLEVEAKTLSEVEGGVCELKNDIVLLTKSYDLKIQI